MESNRGREIRPEVVEEAPPTPMPSSRALLLPPPRTQPGVARDPWRCRGEGGFCAPRALAQPRGDRKPGHRGLSLAAAALPEPGRKFCRALSAGASLAVLLNRKPGCAGAGRWRRERRTPKPRAPAGTSGGEASERTPRGAEAGPGRGGGLLSRGWRRVGVRCRRWGVLLPGGVARACSPSGAGAGAARTPEQGRTGRIPHEQRR